MEARQTGQARGAASDSSKACMAMELHNRGKRGKGAKEEEKCLVLKWVTHGTSVVPLNGHNPSASKTKRHGLQANLTSRMSCPNASLGPIDRKGADHKRYKAWQSRAAWKDVSQRVIDAAIEEIASEHARRSPNE